jgi:hypothetical protein
MSCERVMVKFASRNPHDVCFDADNESRLPYEGKNVSMTSARPHILYRHAECCTSNNCRRVSTMVNVCRRLLFELLPAAFILRCQPVQNQSLSNTTNMTDQLEPLIIPDEPRTDIPEGTVSVIRA